MLAELNALDDGVRCRRTGGEIEVVPMARSTRTMVTGALLVSLARVCRGFGRRRCWSCLRNLTVVLAENMLLRREARPGGGGAMNWGRRLSAVLVGDRSRIGGSRTRSN